MLKVFVVAIGLTSLVTLSRAQEEKRAQMGFMGMRGKKDEISYEEKRAPMGFTGMRGKKAEAQAEDEVDLFEKRAAHMGFTGMRGKKHSQDYLWDIEEEKRVPAGFFGMRGKKGPSAFFGMRGKKGPSGFFGMRGKKGPAGFMGVRGKKDQVHEDIQSLLQLLQDSALATADGDDSDVRLSRYEDLSSDNDGKVQLH